MYISDWTHLKVRLGIREPQHDQMGGRAEHPFPQEFQKQSQKEAVRNTYKRRLSEIHEGVLSLSNRLRSMEKYLWTYLRVSNQWSRKESETGESTLSLSPGLFLHPCQIDELNTTNSRCQRLFPKHCWNVLHGTPTWEFSSVCRGCTDIVAIEDSHNVGLFSSFKMCSSFNQLSLPWILPPQPLTLPLPCLPQGHLPLCTKGSSLSFGPFHLFQVPTFTLQTHLLLCKLPILHKNSV